MTSQRPPGRPPKLRPEFVCPRLQRLEYALRWAISDNDWRTMNRPMRKLYDPKEESERSAEYGRILEGLNYSDLQGKTGLGDSDYPRLILNWQYSEDLLSGPGRLEIVIAQRSEFCKRLAVCLIAAEAGASEAHVKRLCRKWENTPPVLNSEQNDPE